MECSIRARRPLESKRELESECHPVNVLRPKNNGIRRSAGSGGVYVAGMLVVRRNFSRGGRFFALCRLHWWITLRTEGRRRRAF